MVPTLDTRIRTMIKAMQEAVLPALDPGNAIAQEQGHLVLGSLNLLLGQVEYAHTFEVVEAREMIRHIGELLALLQEDSDSRALIANVRADIEPRHAAINDSLSSLGSLQTHNTELRAHIAILIASAQRAASRAVTRTVER